MSNTETLQFEMHAKLLYDVIRRQAGTLSKAILEGIMNSVDAGATECRVNIAPGTVRISDDGKGFRSKEEIRKWFSVFGQPHDESEGKVYGTFRMGRGQLFSYGYNIWRSGTFQMNVDVMHKGLDWDLLEIEPNLRGCQIDIALYEPIGGYALANTIREVKDWVKWCPIPVYVNEENISTNPAHADWDHITDEAYIKLRSNGPLQIYNRGVFVMSVPGWKYGTGGEIVSRGQVKVNFARNDIQSDCPVWKAIKHLVDQSAKQKLEKKIVLNDDERQRLTDSFLAENSSWRVADDKRLITAATGRQYPIKALIDSRWPQLAVAPKGNRKADKLHKQYVAFIVAQETLDRFHVANVRGLLNVIAAAITSHASSYCDRRVADFEELCEGLSDKYDLLSEKEWRAREKLWMNLITKNLHHLGNSSLQPETRNIVLGVSDTCDGWTDGCSYVAIARKFLRDCSMDIDGAVRVGHLLVHEFCHTTPDREDHDHDQAFYEQFHDSVDVVGKFAKKLIHQLPKTAQALDLKLTRQQSRVVSEAAVVTDTVSRLQSVTS